jgi:MarR family transcriptional regulator for hemolysin
VTLARAAKAASRAFDARLAAAGGSLPVWLILLSLRTQPPAAQRELADAIGIESATLTHHLNAMDRDGLLTRRRDPTNRRAHLVELTPAGEALFEQLRGAAYVHDQQLRDGLSSNDIARLDQVLNRMWANVTGSASASVSVAPDANFDEDGNSDDPP